MSVAVAAVSGFLVAVAICALAAALAHRAQHKRIDAMTRYLERAALGEAQALTPTGEDGLSRLQDEIGKTVSALHRTQDDAVRARDGFAHNLANIAHQIRTPLTAIALTAEKLGRSDEEATAGAARMIAAQAERLGRLQEDLLTMAKLDAGVLEMDLQPQDALTLASIAAESVEELAAEAGVSIEVAESGSVAVLADEHWTCEALMNILKNCIEHSAPGSVVRIEYEANPLYVQISILDEGPGFAAHEEARLFERFSTARRGGMSGTGLGLAFARELLELQQGTIRAAVRPGGGARFDIRLYCHPVVTSDG